MFFSFMNFIRVFTSALLFLFFFSTLFAKKTSIKSNQIVGQIVFIKGKVDIISLKTRKRHYARPRQKISIYDEIRTGKNAKVYIILIDSTYLKIRELSVVNIKRKTKSFQDNSMIPISLRILYGKIQLKVSKSIFQEKKFYVKTPTLAAAVRGTNFFVVATLYDARLAVISGHVQVGSRSKAFQKSYILRAKQEIRVEKNKEPSLPRYLSTDILDNYLDHYDITKSQTIKKRIREKNTFIDRLLLKKN